MNNSFDLLIQTEDRLLEEKISRWAPYEEAKRDMDGKWERLCAAHPGENREALALLDACDELVRQKGDAAFLLGLRLGMELGRLELLWSGED